MRIGRHDFRILTAVLFCLFSVPALAENSVSKTKIMFGQVAALHGPAQALGQGMREGIIAAFEEANRSGGINGRKLELESMTTATSQKKPSRPPKRSLIRAVSLHW